MLAMRESRTSKSRLLGKRIRGIVCANGFPANLAALPTVEVQIGNRKLQALVDTGCSQTIAAKKLLSWVRPCSHVIISVNGAKLSCGKGELTISIQNRSIELEVLVLKEMITHYELVLGMDVIQEMGGLQVNGERVVLGDPSPSVASLGKASKPEEPVLVVDETDFNARFDGKQWIVSWKWKDKPPKLTNKVPCYSISPDIQQDWESEVQSWIDEGILKPVAYGDKVDSLTPIMAVSQSNKGKVRPVMDFREMNKFVLSHPGDCDVCDETLRNWRIIGDNVTLLDLRKAYLQLHVDEKLWKYQVVEFKGSHYYLTRLGFGLCSAPRIMTSVLRKVLSLDEVIQKGTDNYLDDILVNNDIVSTARVADHLSAFGLKSKPFESVEQSKILGLKMKWANGELRWERGNELPILDERISRRELFSVCGLLVGHYPVCGWLRVACSFVKRVSEGSRWDDDIGPRAQTLLSEILQNVNENDPVGGRWAVSNSSCRLWCDASSIAIGCAVEVNGEIIEDSSWLRKRDDGNHINVSELESVLKGLNLVAKWNFRKVEVLTDSVTVHSWLVATLNGTHRVKVKGMSEMLVKRRLSLVKEFCDEYGMELSVKWVETAKNKADILTRVPKRWLQTTSDACLCLTTFVQQVHSRHHLGVDRTYYLAKKEDPSITRKEVEDCIQKCHQCKSIDPAPITWEKGTLSVEENWTRLAADVTHFNGICYLTLVDCGPSRFTIWRKMPCEDAARICAELLQIFRERGPPKEVLMDNSTAFRSQQLKRLFGKWHVLPSYRCAYRPQGNGIVERCHRTIKRMAARACADPLDMVYWFNSTPKSGSEETTVPASQLYAYSWRTVPSENHEEEQVAARGGFPVGSRVFVKPPGARCHSRWTERRVTAVNSPTNVEVDGIPRHIADIRLVPESEASSEDEEDDDDDYSPRPQRTRRPPDRYGNNIFDT